MNIFEMRDKNEWRSKAGSLAFAKQSGFTLIELMIAGVLGLLLIGGVIQLFSGSRDVHSMQEQLASLQENGRFALSILDEQIRMGGWTELESSPQAIDISSSTDGVNDSLVVSYRVASGSADNLDCNGNLVTGGLIRNTFSVNAGNLQCQGNGGGAAQILVSNVESFQVLYGVETDGTCPDGVVNSYINQTTVQNTNLAANILSVQVAILLSSDIDVLLESKAGNYTFLDQQLAIAADKKSRRLFQQTIFIPNAVFRTVGTPEAVIECMISKV